MSDGRVEAACREQVMRQTPPCREELLPRRLRNKAEVMRIPRDILKGTIVTRKTLQIYKQNKIKNYTFERGEKKKKKPWNHRKEGKERLKRSTRPYYCLKSRSSLLKPFLMDVCLICS